MIRQATITPDPETVEVTEERVAQLPRGVRVTVRQGEGASTYTATGLLIGLTHDVDGPRIRLFGEDRLERRIPLPARVTVDA